MAHDVIRLQVTGGRDYADEAQVGRVLNHYLKKVDGDRQRLVVIQGEARGLDTLVKNWCKANGVPCIGMEAHWDYYSKAGGPIRNGWMLKFCMPTHGVVFPGGTGTADMHKRMKQAGIRCRRVKDRS